MIIRERFFPMVRLLHFIPDDKFADLTIEALDEFSDVENVYCMYNRSCLEEVKWHRHTDRVLFTPYGSDALKKILRDVRAGRFDGVVFHSFPDRIDYFASQCGSVKKIFIPWGHDIYGMMRFSDYLPRTLGYVRSRRFKGTLRHRIGWPVRHLQHWLSTIPKFPMKRSVHTIIKYFDYIAPVLDTDYDLFCKAYPSIKMPPRISFQYGNYDGVDLIPFKGVKGAILINNSATATGNHADVFELLNRLGVDSKMIVPLSYGGDPSYREFVKDEGKAILGSRFVPILDFMAKDDYFKFISQCTHMVMGHRRQQALGNIIWGLASGLKVFFWQDSPVYQEFSKLGFKVYSLEDATVDEYMIPLREEDREKNAELAARFYGKDAMKRKLNNLIDAIKS